MLWLEFKFSLEILSLSPLLTMVLQEQSEVTHQWLHWDDFLGRKFIQLIKEHSTLNAKSEKIQQYIEIS